MCSGRDKAQEEFCYLCFLFGFRAKGSTEQTCVCVCVMPALQGLSGRESKVRLQLRFTQK